jgi:hypothetical protein
MKHAGPAALDRLGALLGRVRALPGLTERKPGIFYRRGVAWLHFHEDAAGLFVDVKLGGRGFTRLPVNSEAECQALLRALQATL